MKSKQEYTILEKYIIKYSKDFFIKNIIIVTHTIPLKRFCCNKRIATELNSSFEKLLEYKKISHWIFGHTHENFNETYKGVHFVCNSRGRPADKNRINYSIKQMVI